MFERSSCASLLPQATHLVNATDCSMRERSHTDRPAWISGRAAGSAGPREATDKQRTLRCHYGHTRQGDSPQPRRQTSGMNTFVYRYSSSSLSTITLCFLRRRSRPVCMLFTSSPSPHVPEPVLWHAVCMEGSGPNSMILVSSWSLEGFLFSAVSISVSGTRIRLEARITAPTILECCCLPSPRC